jgi:hypothetical protein
MAHDKKDDSQNTQTQKGQSVVADFQHAVSEVFQKNRGGMLNGVNNLLNAAEQGVDRGHVFPFSTAGAKTS